jgi:pimeloyl-ACP methyl ester carboxylesterase
MQSRHPKPRTPLVVVLPGNPGLAEFYRELAQDLEGRGHEVVVASHPPLFDPAAGLMPYARHHVTAALQHLQASARTVDDVEVVLVGHSVGAYLAYLIAARGLLPVARVIMIFPFLARPAFSGRLILRAAACRPLFATLVALFRTLPARGQRWLVEAAGAGAQTPAVLRALASPLPFAAGAMARVERAEIAARPDATYLLEEPWFGDLSRLAVMLCPADRWVSPAVARQLAPVAHRLEPPMGHSLVVDPGERRRVTAVLLALLAGEPAVAIRSARAPL